MILASGSPRRVELMKGAGFEFEQCTRFSVDETYPSDMPYLDVPEYLACKKANAYAWELCPSDILITADTLVYAEGAFLGKPEDDEDAVRMLQKLSGKTHIVLTGVCVRTRDKTLSFTASSEVGFRKLSENEIKYYVKNMHPLDKAGAYGIQEWIGYVGIEFIRGSYFNVMGLPIQQLYVKLDELID